MNSNSDFSPQTYTSTSNSFLLVSLIIFSLFAVGWGLIFSGYDSGWFLLIFILPILILYKQASVSTLMITYGGLSITYRGKTSSFIWSDIDEFVVMKRGSSKFVAFGLSPSGQARGVGRKSFLPKIDEVEYGKYKIPDNFGFGAEELREYLQQLKKSWGR